MRYKSLYLLSKSVTLFPRSQDTIFIVLDFIVSTLKSIDEKITYVYHLLDTDDLPILGVDETTSANLSPLRIVVLP